MDWRFQLLELSVFHRHTQEIADLREKGHGIRRDLIEIKQEDPLRRDMAAITFDRDRIIGAKEKIL